VLCGVCGVCDVWCLGGAWGWYEDVVASAGVVCVKMRPSQPEASPNVRFTNHNFSRIKYRYTSLLGRWSALPCQFAEEFGMVAW
jgi:hypothetical protein